MQAEGSQLVLVAVGSEKQKLHVPLIELSQYEFPAMESTLDTVFFAAG